MSPESLSKLIKLGAEMAVRNGMPDPEELPGIWSSRVPEKLRSAIFAACYKADAHCRDWSIRLRQIYDHEVKTPDE
jgi:hypothetical protein